MAERFGAALQRMRKARGLSQPQLAKPAFCSASYVSHLEAGTKLPSQDIAQRLDEVLDAKGALIALTPLPPQIAGPGDSDPWETAELVRRLELSDVGPAAVEKMQATTERLCCEYSYRPPAQLRAEAQQWLGYVGKLLRGKLTLAEHRDLLVAAGWLALLVGCLEHDLGVSSAAETTRVAAARLGREAAHSEIVGWSWEMAAWMALTRNDPMAVLSAARAGQEASPRHSVAGQLAGLEAKALARLGRTGEIDAVLERGYWILTTLPTSVNPSNHFVVDPSKWNFLAMDCYRVAGRDDRAIECANQIVRDYTLPDGTVRSPMRVSEARMTRAVIAARSGELEGALAEGERALEVERRSVPSLLLPARELIAVLDSRHPGSEAVNDFREHLRGLAAA